MKLLITGGLGFIGYEIAATSNCETVTFGRGAVSEGLSLPAHVRHETGSVLDNRRLIEILDAHQITHIIHAAGARTSVCAKDPALALESNVYGADSLCKAAKSSGKIESLILLSSAAVFGKRLSRVDESALIAPSSNYAISKAAAELVVKGHFDLKTVTVRPGFVVGVSSYGLVSNSTLNRCIRSALSNQTVELKCANRFFVHLLGDLAKDIHQLYSTEGTFHLPGVATTIEAFAKCVSEVAVEFGFSPRIQTVEDDSLQVPADLNFDRFNDFTRGSRSPELKGMIRSVMKDELHRKETICS